MTTPSKETHVKDENGFLQSSIEEFASLDSWEANMNAKGDIQIHIKIYPTPDQNDGQAATRLAEALAHLRTTVKAEGFTIAGES